MQDINENVHVAIRIRSIPTESRMEPRNRVGCCVVPENKNQRNEFVSVSITDPEGRKGTKKFAYDRVFDSDSSQESVHQVVQPIISRCLDGFNGCVFAYGQTSRSNEFILVGKHTQWKVWTGMYAVSSLV
jgi:kinesin family protein C2/C3